MSMDELLAQASSEAEFGDDLELVTLPVPVNGKSLRVVVRALTREERITIQGGVSGLAVEDEDAKPDLMAALQVMKDAARSAVVRPAFNEAWWGGLHDANQSAIFDSAMRLASPAPTKEVSGLATFPSASGSGAGDGR